MLTNREAFKRAHTMAKEIHVAGESYQVTFGACLKRIKAQEKAKPSVAKRIVWTLAGVSIGTFAAVILAPLLWIITFVAGVVAGVWVANLLIFASVWAIVATVYYTAKDQIETSKMLFQIENA